MRMKIHCKSLFFCFQKKIEDARAQMQVLSLDKELKELQRAVITSDKLAATELCITAKQLKALGGTVLRINQERAEVNQHGELMQCLVMPGSGSSAGVLQMSFRAFLAMF